MPYCCRSIMDVGRDTQALERLSFSCAGSWTPEVASRPGRSRGLKAHGSAHKNGTCASRHCPLAFTRRKGEIEGSLATSSLNTLWSILRYCVSPYPVNPPGETVIRPLHKNRACSRAWTVPTQTVRVCHAGRCATGRESHSHIHPYRTPAHQPRSWRRTQNV